MGHICIVEDDASVRELICCTLRSAGFEYKAYENGESFLADYETERAEVELALLDIMLPGMDGLEVFRIMRNMEPGARAIFLTAKDTEIDRVTGLDLGADDYLGKPFGVLELIARVKAVLRRSQRTEGGELKAGVISMDAASRKVYVSGEKAELTYKEFEVLRYLMQNEGIVLSRDSFLSNIWGVDVEIETRTVDMHIKTLREKLGAAGKYIKTVRSVGYEFIPD